ncbi:sulfatase-like hydrolase/transferase [Paenibacillus sp. LMG 31456]|uniref:Sulfatase-like hydrolase/transferase n=1 Tax=Paenibacillus foliorum TaxID=2654974 RepID=A0A972GTP1_9BACL|nr:sulfatase [Paenibacillus foliorum]NOU93993.1 sulfatase-like hydrolase/transferase [Paenibacillus foliorum]
MINVICILVDTLRRDHLGCYGNSSIETPNLDRFAEGSALFNNAYIGSYPCMPARQDLWTGQLNFLWRGWSPLEHDKSDMVTLLSDHDKTTMLITDHYHLWQYGSGNYHFSFNGMEIIRGQEMDNWITSPDIPITYPASEHKLNRNWPKYVRNTAHFRKEEDYFAAQVFQKSIDWVEQNKSLSDFFLMIDCFDPHEPFDPPPGYAEKYNPGYTGESVIWPKYGDADRMTPEELQQVHALYCGEVSFVDHWFGKFYDKLEQLELLDNTMVIVTSDHGFLFGEHNWLGKHARLLYQDIARTPLLIHHPGIKPGVVYEELVQMADLTPTIMQTMGVQVPSHMQGESLVPLWEHDGGCGTEETMSGLEGTEANIGSTTVGLPSSGGIRSRQELIFGVFGGPVYCTDGEWLLVKKPLPGNSPLYWYTRSHYNNWDFGQQNLYADSEERLKQWDGERFPTQYENAHPGHAAPRLIRDEGDRESSPLVAHDELYCIAWDHAQQHDVASERPDVLERLKQGMRNKIIQIAAPKEQLQRLGLDETDRQ